MDKAENCKSDNISATQIFLKFLQCFPLRLNLAYLARQSQNHRMDEVESVLWESPNPTSLLKQGQKNQAVQDCVQLCFEYVQGWRLYNTSGEPVPAFNHSHSNKKNIYSNRIFCISIYTHCLFSMSKNESSLAVSSLHPLIRYLQTSIVFPLTLLFSRLCNPNSFRLSTYERCSSSL